MTPIHIADDQTRWSNEQAYFDNQEYQSGPLDPLTVQRYMKCERSFLSSEYPFFTLGDLTGQTVLELGCGDGANSILLAMRGARVVALDLSPKAIAAARKRAAWYGLEDRIDFQVTPFELFQSELRFDAIIAFAFLHHAIPVLDDTLRQLKQLARPGSRFVFVEPVAPSRWLRCLRLSLPIRVDGTEGERPLEDGELNVISNRLGRVKLRFFHATLRLAQFILPGGNFERSAPWQRRVFEAFGRVDQFLLQTLGWRKLGSITVIEAQI